MKIIFLDFDGVMDTSTYNSYLVKNNMPNAIITGDLFLIHSAFHI